MNPIKLASAGALALVLVLASSPLPAARADEPGKGARAALEALKAEYKASSDQARAERKTKGEAIGNAAIGRIGLTFGPRFLRFAKEHPGNPEAAEAANLALQQALYAGDQGAQDWKEAIRFIRERLVTDPNVKECFFWLSIADEDPASESVLREILAKNRDRDVRGAAAQALVKRVERAASYAQLLRSRPDALKRTEDHLGKAGLRKILDKGDRARKNADALKDSFRGEYTDFFPIIVIGKPAPEVVSQDLDGKTTRLSELKGKVVVLDIWTTWCGPCKAMIPHEREMVGRLKDKPFRLVSISADEKKQTLVDFLAKEPMPWAHWWAGESGGIMSAWEVTQFPTIYVLDASGVIRHKDLRGEELEKAVNELLKEMEAKKTAAK